MFKWFKKLIILWLMTKSPITFKEAAIHCGYPVDQTHFDESELRCVLAILALMNYQFAEITYDRAFSKND